MMTKTQISKLKKMMNDLDYPFEAPLKESFIESIIQIKFNSNSTNCLEKLCNEVSILFNNQPDYLTFLRAMDGFEVNGLRLFSLSTRTILDSQLTSYIFLWRELPNSISIQCPLSSFNFHSVFHIT